MNPKYKESFGHLKIGDYIIWYPSSSNFGTLSGTIKFIGRDGMPVIETNAGQTMLLNAAPISIDKEIPF